MEEVFGLLDDPCCVLNFRDLVQIIYHEIQFVTCTMEECCLWKFFLYYSVHSSFFSSFCKASLVPLSNKIGSVSLASIKNLMIVRQRKWSSVAPALQIQ